MIDLIGAGCRSPLEIWGALEVFTGPDFARLRRQTPVTVGGQLFYLDLYAKREKVNFELDGAAWHGSRLQRERDIRRDAALATLGILVVRFSYARLMTEPDVVRREAAAILAPATDAGEGHRGRGRWEGRVRVRVCARVGRICRGTG